MCANRVCLGIVMGTVLGLAVVTPALADLIPPGHKGVTHHLVFVEFLLLRVVLQSRTWQAAVLAVATNGATLLLSLASGRSGF